MTDKLLVRITDTDPVTYTWLVITDTSTAISAANCNDLTSLPNDYQKLAVEVLVPSQFLLLTQAVLPGVKQQQLAQAVPYALEPMLAEDIDKLHFALGAPNDSAISVAVVRHTLLQAWLKPFAQAGLQVIAMLPDVLTLPIVEQHWSMMQENNTVWVRTGSQTGFAVEASALGDVLKAAYKAASVKPTGIYFFGDPDQNISASISALQLTLQAVPAPDLATLAQESQTGAAINLLQGPYQPRLKLSALKKLWRINIILLAIWLITTLGGNLLELAQLSAQQKKLQQHINAIYHRLFPQANQVIAPKLRIEQELAKLQQSDGHANKLFNALAAVGKALPSLSGQLQSLEYAQNKLLIKLTAKDFNNLNAFSQQLKQSGFTVTEDNAISAGQQVEARLVINL